MNTTITIEYYPVDNDVKPYFKWYKKLDRGIQAIILQRLTRIVIGLFGDHEYLRNGVWELKFKEGGGVRIYFGKQISQIIILWGGIKSTQHRDIERAEEYWNNHNLRLDHGKKESSLRV